MSVGLLERASSPRRALPEPVPLIDDGLFGSNLVGIAVTGNRPREFTRGRTMTANAALGYSDRGMYRNVSTTTGVYTARREWADWEPTSNFSFIAYWVVTARNATSAANMGNTSGSNGYSFNERFGNGTRRYNAGGLFLDPAGSPLWPLNVFNLSALTYTGSVLRGYCNGTDDGSVSGGSNVTYDSFCRLFAGNNPDTGALTGGIFYMAMVNRIVTPDEVQFLTSQPFALFGPQRRMTTYFADLSTADALFAQICL